VLKFIRRHADAAWVKFIFLAIVIVFIFWGMGGVVGGEKAQIVARVNNETIEPADFDRAFTGLQRFYRDVYKDNFKPELIKALDLKGRAVDQLIQVALLQQEANRIGLQVGETELRDSIRAVPAFQQDGVFSKDLYVRALRANNLTPGDFEDAERQELLVKKMQDLITAGIHVSDAEVHERFMFDNEKVNLRYIKVDPAAFIPEVKLTDEEVQAYFDKNKESLREPERVRIEYIVYAPERFTDKADVADAEIQRYYDAHQTDYQVPEQVRARHILLKVAPDADDALKAEVRKKAEEVLAKVKAGEDFAELAKQYSEDSTAGEGGDLGLFDRGKMVKPFEDAAFALAPGATSDIVETTFGFHIIKVEAKQEAHTRTLDEARAQILATLKQEKARELAQAQAEADRAKVAGGQSMAAVAQAAGLSVAAPAPFAQAEVIVGLGRNPTLEQAAFAGKAGDVGAVVDTPQGACLYRVLEKIDAHIPQLADVRPKVEEKLKNEKAAGLAKAKADALLAAAQKGDLQAVATAENLKVEETGGFAREGGYVPGIGNAPDLKKAAFQLTPEKPVAPAVYTASGSSVIAALKERIAPDEEKFKTDKDNLRRQAEEKRKGQVMEEFVNYLKARASIQISQDFLASVSDTGVVTDGGRRRR